MGDRGESELGDQSFVSMLASGALAGKFCAEQTIQDCWFIKVRCLCNVHSCTGIRRITARA